MLVITENTFEKPNNPKYPRGSKVAIKRNNSQVKVISNRITPYCGDITKSKRELIKTRKFLKESDKIKYHYLYARKHLCNGEHERKIKLFSVEKTKNLNHLEKFSKIRKKKNQVIARRVNYNVILNNSYVKNVAYETNSFLVHLKGRKRKSHIRRSARKDCLTVREVALDKAKDIGGRRAPSLHPLRDSFHFKVKTNHHHVASQNVAKSKQFDDVEVNGADVDGIIANNSALDVLTVVVNRERQHPSSHLSRHLARKALLSARSMRKNAVNAANATNATDATNATNATHATSSLIDSIINLSNELNKTSEKKEESEHEYDRSVLRYVRRILSDHNFHYDIVSSAHKNEINELKRKIKKYNDIRNFYFRKLFKHIERRNESSRKRGNGLHTAHCYSSDYDVHYDARGRSNSCKRGSNEHIRDEKKERKIRLKLKAPSPSLYTHQRCHSDNYFSEKLKKKKKRKKRKSHVYQPVNPVEQANLSKHGGSNSLVRRIDKRITSKHLTNLKPPLDHQNAGARGDHAKVGNASGKGGGGGVVVGKKTHVGERAASGNHGIAGAATVTTVCNKIKHGNNEKENTLLCVTSGTSEPNDHKGNFHLDRNPLHCVKKCTSTFTDQKKHIPERENHLDHKLEKDCPSVENPHSGKSPKTEKRLPQINLKKEKWTACIVHKKVLLCSGGEKLHGGTNNLGSFTFSENAGSSVVGGRSGGGSFSGSFGGGASANAHSECTCRPDNVKRNDSLANSTDDNASSNVYFSADNQSSHTMSSLRCNSVQCVSSGCLSLFKGSYKEQSIISTFSSSTSRHRAGGCGVAPPGKESNGDHCANLVIPFQRSVKTKAVDATVDAAVDAAAVDAVRGSTGDKQRAGIDPPELAANNLEDQKSLRSSVNSLTSAELVKTPVVSNIQSGHFEGIPKIGEKGGSSFCIFKTKRRRERLSSKTPLFVDVPNLLNTANDIDLVEKGTNKVNNFTYNNKERKMNNNDDHNFLVEECLKKCLKENASKFRTNEDYERYCNEDKILNPEYIPQESKRLGERFLQSHQEKFASYRNSSFHYQPYMSNAECGNSCFKDPPGYNLYNDPNSHFMNNMKINVFNNTASQNTSNSTFNNVGIYSNSHINSINKEFYMKKGNDYSNDVFIKYYEQYANKDNDKNEAKKFNYTDCYDFKNTLLNGLSREDSFGSDDDLKNEDSEMNFLKDSLNSFDNLESTEKKYEEILRDFNGKIPLLHKVLKPLPVKNRSNNFDICLYLLQKHGGDLNNEENICILRDKEIVQHSAIYDPKKGCIKSNITNVTNIKLYQPKWHNKKKIVERLKEQSCFNPFTIFGSAPSLLDFDEVFDKDVYNKFVSRNSRKSHSLLRILAKQKVINNLNDKITDKEWPQVHSYLKKRWSKETNIELNWACDPLLYEELEWYLSTNNEYLNMTDKVADIEVCYCPTLDPSSYYAWNDSRVIYTNLCYNKSKEDGEPGSQSVKYGGNKNAELKNKDKQVSFRKRASGCEHLMFQQNLMKQKKLSKRKKRLLRKKKKMLKEKNQMLREQGRRFAENNGEGAADGGAADGGAANMEAVDVEGVDAADAADGAAGLYMEAKEGSENDFKHAFSSQHNRPNFSNDPCMSMRMRMNMDMRMSALKSKKHNHDSAYYPNIFSTKKKKSVYRSKNYDEDVIPIMTVNTSLYRHNLDNKYNCSNTAFDYIKNKDNTIKFFASPKKTRKNNSVKKSVNNSDSFYYLNSSMINSDNIYNNNLDSFDSKDSADGNDSASVFHKDTFDASDDKMRSKKQVELRSNPMGGIMHMDRFDNASESVCENLRMNEHTSYISNSNVYEFRGAKNAYDFRKNDHDGLGNSRGMGYMTRDNDNENDNENDKENFPSKGGSFCYRGGGGPTNDYMQPFRHMSMADKYGNANSNVNMNIFSNIRMYEQNFNKHGDHGDGRNSLSRDYDMDNHGGSCMGKGPFTKSSFVDRSYYDMEQTSFSSNNFGHFSTREMAPNELQYGSIFRTDLSKPSFAEQSQSRNQNQSQGQSRSQCQNQGQNRSQNRNEAKFPVKELSERYPSKCKGTNAEYSDSHGDKASGNRHNNRNDDAGTGDNCNYFECKYENSSNKHANGKNSQMIANYFLSKNAENYDPTEKKNKMNEHYGAGESQKSTNNAMADMNILKITQQNIDKKNILEKKIKSSMSFYTNNKDTDNSTVNFNSKRLSNSNIIVNENRKIRRYTNKMCQDDNTSFEHSENGKGQGNKKGSVESPSSRTSETSMSSAFKMATSVFKKLF